MRNRTVKINEAGKLEPTDGLGRFQIHDAFEIEGVHCAVSAPPGDSAVTIVVSGVDRYPIRSMPSKIMWAVAK
jgi:hypothetical protein